MGSSGQKTSAGKPKHDLLDCVESAHCWDGLIEGGTMKRMGPTLHPSMPWRGSTLPLDLHRCGGGRGGVCLTHHNWERAKGEGTTRSSPHAYLPQTPDSHRLGSSHPPSQQPFDMTSRIRVGTPSGISRLHTRRRLHCVVLTTALTLAATLSRPTAFMQDQRVAKAI